MKIISKVEQNIHCGNERTYRTTIHNFLQI